MKKLFIYTIILALTAFTSCRKGGFLYEGDIISETRSLSDFSYVQVKDVFNIKLRQSDSPGVIIRCGEGLMPGIETTIRNDSLFISNNNHFDWTRKYSRTEIIILTDSMQKITIDEPCNFTTDGVYTQDKLIVWVTNNLSEIDIKVETGQFYLVNSWINTGNYRVAGSTGYAYIVMNGTANLDASALEARDIYIEQKSIDDIKINVTGYLTYGIENSGDIICLNRPQTIDKKYHTGSGELIFE